MAFQSDLHIGQDEFKAVDVRKRIDFVSKDAGLFDRMNEWVISKSPVKTKTKVTFFRLLATMINAGVSLVKGLNILEEQTEDPRMKRICSHLAKTVESGQSLSFAMEDFPDVFEEAEIGMIKSGEMSGKLNDVLLRIASQTEKSAKMLGKIKGAMMYPAVIIFVLIIAFFLMSIMVVPGIKEIFIGKEDILPMPTIVLFKISDFMLIKVSQFKIFEFNITIYMCMLMAIVMSLFIFTFLYWKKTAIVKPVWDKMMLIFPVFGQLEKKICLSRFCDSISTLTKSGISIVKTIKITSEIVGNDIYRRRVLLIADDVQHGITIAENIRDNKALFPPMVVSMIGVGEQTAQLDSVCEKVADFYNDEVDNMIKNLSSLMEPMIILLLGGVVGFMVAAIMLPIMKMGEAFTE